MDPQSQVRMSQSDEEADDEQPLEEEEPLPEDEKQLAGILAEEWEYKGQIFSVGQRFTIIEQMDNNGNFGTFPLVQAYPVGRRVSFAIPRTKLMIGSREITKSIKYIVDGVSTDSADWDLAPVTTTDIPVPEERFGKLFLKLAQGLRSRADDLITLGCHEKSLRYLKSQFENTFMLIYNGVPEEVKNVLSQQNIDLKDLPITLLYDKDRVRQDLGTVQLGPQVYVRLYLKSPAHEKKRNSAHGVYIGSTSNFRGRNKQHMACTRDAQGYHYQLARGAYETRVNMLCHLDTMDEAILLLAEQLFVLYLDSYAYFLGNQMRTDTANWDAPVEMFREIRQVAFAEISDLPVFRLKTPGANMATPLISSYSSPSWSCIEEQDRSTFYLNRIRTPRFRRQGVQGYMTISILTFADGSSVTIQLPVKAVTAFMHSSRQLSISVEVMRNKQIHPFTYARLPEVGPVSGFDLANAVGVRVAGRDSLGRLRGFYCQVRQPEFSRAITVEGKEIKVPQGYLDAMLLRSSLLGEVFRSSVHPKLESKLLKVYDAEHDFLEHQTKLTSRKPDTSNPLPEPRIISLAENTKYLEAEHELNFEPDPERKPCDLCKLYWRHWSAENPISRQHMKHTKPCKGNGDVCENWGHLHIPASWSSQERLEGDLKDVFFKRLYEQEDDMLPMHAERFAARLQAGDQDTLEITVPEGEGLMKEGIVQPANEEGADDLEDLLAAEESSGEEEGVDPLIEFSEIEGAIVNDAPTQQDELPEPLVQLDVTKNDKLLVIVGSKKEQASTFFLVILNDIQNAPVWVDLDHFKHQEEELWEYWAVSRDENLPKWARGRLDRKRAHDSPDVTGNVEEEVQGSQAQEDVASA